MSNVIKVIKVDSCGGCPWSNYFYECEISGKRTVEEYELDGMPDWCPLPDDNSETLKERIADLEEEVAELYRTMSR